MSRTFKDKPNNYEVFYTASWGGDTPERGKFTKKKRYYQEIDGMSTPSWWWHLTTTRVKRTEWTIQSKKINLDNIEDFDYTNYWKKPQEHYW